MTDFRIFVTGVEMLASGKGDQLYQFGAQERTQNRLEPETRTSGLLPFNHLAYELLFYWPVARFSYRTGLIAWALINAGLVFLIGFLLRPYSRTLARITNIPVALFFFAFYPVMFVLGEGQDSLLFTTFLVLSLRSMDGGRIFLAGFLLALALFKFHLALSIAFFVFVLRGKWRGVAGFATGGVLVGVVSLALVGPAIFHDYPSMLRRQSVMTPWGFNPSFMPNLRGLLEWGLGRWLDKGQFLLAIFMSSAIVGVVATWLVLRQQAKRATNNNESMAYAVAVLTTILISYHFHMQDLSIALLPMLILAERAISDRYEQTLAVVVRPSTSWAVVVGVAVAGLYLYRVAGILFPILVMGGCILCLPVFLLWVAALRWWCMVHPPAVLAGTRSTSASQIGSQYSADLVPF